MKYYQNVHLTRGDIDLQSWKPEFVVILTIKYIESVNNCIKTVTLYNKVPLVNVLNNMNEQ